MKRLKIQSQDPMVALESIDASIAIEDFSMRTIRNRIADSIPNMVHSAKEVISRSSLGKTDNVVYNFNEKVLEKAIGDLVYMKVSDVNVFVPKGFQGLLTDYMTILGSAVRYCKDIPARLTAYNQFLSLLISNPDTRTSSEMYFPGTGDEPKDRAAITNIMSTFFTDKNHTDRARLGDTFSSSGNILEAARMLKDITDVVGKKEVSDTKTLVANCSALLDGLRDKSKTEAMANMSPEMLKSLANSTLALARDVELVGSVHFALGMVVNAMVSNEKLIIQMARYDR